MKTAVMVALMTLAASGQTAKKHCPEPPETIPYSAVEPAYQPEKAPFCPRTEYELKWFVEEEEPNPYITSGSYCFNNGCIVTPKSKSKLVFKPMCVKKDTD